MDVAAVIVAAGDSSRCIGDVPKQFRDVGGRPLLATTIARFEAASSIDRIVLVVPQDSFQFIADRVVDCFHYEKVRQVVSGGPTRQHSVWNGLQALPRSTGIVAIHDGARPLTAPADIDRVVATARREGAAIVAAQVTDTVKQVTEAVIVGTLDRKSLYLAQTPQAFHYDLIMDVHRAAAGSSDTESYTDDASMVEARGHTVHIVEASGPNPKVTTPEDLTLIETLLLREEHEEPANRSRL